MKLVSGLQDIGSVYIWITIAGLVIFIIASLVSIILLWTNNATIDDSSGQPLSKDAKGDLNSIRKGWTIGLSIFIIFMIMAIFILYHYRKNKGFETIMGGEAVLNTVTNAFRY